MKTDEEIYSPKKLKRLRGVKEARLLREKGHTYHEIARILEISSMTAWKWAKDCKKGDLLKNL